MSNVIVVANNVTLHGMVDRMVSEIMFFLRIIDSERPSLLDYVEGVSKPSIGLINVGQ